MEGKHRLMLVLLLVGGCLLLVSELSLENGEEKRSVTFSDGLAYISGGIISRSC